jgi:hypothetical protein
VPLGEDICRTVGALTVEDKESDALPEPAVQQRPAILHPIVDAAVSG